MSNSDKPTIIPAAPGFFILERRPYDSNPDFDDAVAHAVIAWRIGKDDEFGDNYARPITASYPSETLQDYDAIQQPNGRIFLEGCAYRSVRDYLAGARAYKERVDKYRAQMQHDREEARRDAEADPAADDCPF